MTITIDFEAAYNWFMALNIWIQIGIGIFAYMTIATIVGKTLYFIAKINDYILTEDNESIIAASMFWPLTLIIVIGLGGIILPAMILNKLIFGTWKLK